MRVLAFFALIVLSTTAFNSTDYNNGVGTLLNFNETQIQDGITCMNALSSDIQDIYSLIKSLSFDNISLSVGNLLLQLQTDLQTTCKPYFADYYMSENANMTNITEIIKENIKTNYPEIIQYVGNFVEMLFQGQDFEAGIDQAQIIELLVQAQEYSVPEVQVTPVPFNKTAFFTEYNAALFQVLEIDAQANITGLVECSDYVQNATLAFLYIKNNFTALDFEQQLDGVEYIINLVLDSVRHCDAAGEIEELVYGPVIKAFEQDPANFTLQVIENIAANFPALQTSIENEIDDIKTGDYYGAGQEKAGRLYNIFSNLVDFSNRY